MGWTDGQTDNKLSFCWLNQPCLKIINVNLTETKHLTLLATGGGVDSTTLSGIHEFLQIFFYKYTPKVGDFS